MGLSFLNRKREMTHERVRELLSGYLDGRLSAGQRTALERHLEGCRDCGHELRALRATQQMVQSLPPVRLPRGFTLEAAPRPALLPRGFFWLRGATAVAAVAFVALLTVPALMSGGGMSAPRPAASQPTGAFSQTKAADSQPALQAQPAAGARGSEPAGGAAERSLAPAAQPAPANQPPAAAAAPAGAPAAAAKAAAPLAQPAAPPAPAPAAPATAAPAADAAKAASTEEPAQHAILSPLQMAVGGLALLLALATGAIWWRHRRP